MKSNLVEKLSKMTKGKVNDKNANYVVAGFGGLIVLVIVIIILAVVGDGQNSSGGTNNEVKETISTAQTDGTEGTDSVSEIGEVPLEENEDPEINDAVTRYFDAMASGDMDTVVALERPMTDVKKLTIQIKSEYIESFDNIKVYSKVGPVPDSKILFVYHEVRFNDIDTVAAALVTMYATKDENGQYYFYGGEIDEEQQEYISVILGQEDTKELFEKVDVKYQEALDADPALKQMVSDLPDKIKEEAIGEFAKLESTESEETETVEESVAEPTEQKEIDFESVRATDGVNVRAAASEDADKVGKLAKGETVKRTETLENGWSAVEYKDQICYVKSEYLAVSSITYKDGSVESLSGTAIPSTTINVRTSASENADKLGVANKGEELTVLEVLENGWTKIEYDGKEAYVKSEYLEH